MTPADSKESKSASRTRLSVRAAGAAEWPCSQTDFAYGCRYSTIDEGERRAFLLYCLKGLQEGLGARDTFATTARPCPGY